MSWFVRHAFAIAVLPGTAAIAVPLWLCRRNAIEFRAPAGASDWLCVALAAIAFVIGAALFVSTVFLFAGAGRGTLAPWDPPARLVVRGPYRYVRNPMISGVLLVLVAESLALRSWVHAEWAALFFVINAIYIPLLEEPQLAHRFGDEYRAYARHVPRLIPRLTAYRPETT